MSAPLVSVVLPSYNRADHLPMSITSVLGQTLTDLELIVVDDGSTDNTAELVAKIDDPRLRFMALDENRGASAARNAGIAAARGKYIAFQDSDDEWLPEKLARQIARLEADPEIALLFCSLLRIDPPSNEQRHVPYNPVPHERDAFLKALLAQNFMWTQTWVVRADVLKSGCLFNEALVRGEDWDLALRIAENYTVRHLDEVLVKAFVTPGSLLSQNARRGEDLKIMLQSHWSQLQQYPEILSDYYRGIAIANRLRSDAGYRDGVCWALKALRLNVSNYRCWLTMVLALLGPLAPMLLRLVRKDSENPL